MYEINFYKYNFLHADFFSFFCYHLLTSSLIFCFSNSSFRNTTRVSNCLDFVSPYLGPKCLQRLSADDKSHWKQLNILINFNNCFQILKGPLNLDLIEPLCYIFVKSDLQGYTSIFCQHIIARRLRAKIVLFRIQA